MKSMNLIYYHFLRVFAKGLELYKMWKWLDRTATKYLGVTKNEQ